MTMWAVSRVYDVEPNIDMMDLWEDKLVDLDAVVSYLPGRGVDVTVHVEARTALDAIEESAHVSDVVGEGAEELHVITQLEHDRRAEESTIPELMSAAEVADELGVTRQRVHQLRATTAFPEPLADLRGGAVWDASAIRKFNEEWERKPGRPRNDVVVEVKTAKGVVHRRVQSGTGRVTEKRSAATGKFIARNPRTGRTVRIGNAARITELRHPTKD
ncbi:hypothetical protein [Mycobacterium sp. SWH-M5]|uniref:hypothetical protein n=1 Tax=Mycolicibacterium hippocampi TaxID=659824 RepID=UPI00093AC8AF|nr:hypothetical protein EB74_28040 [Mycobacterium sp. SWH-M5]